MELGLRVEGAETAKQRMLDMAERAVDFTAAWQEVKAAVQRREARWLESRGEGSFAPLAPSTLKRRPRRSDRPLDKEGTLWDSLVGDTASSYFSYDATRCEIGTASESAHWHMYPRKHMPARPPLPPFETIIPDVRQIMRCHVRGEQARLT